MEKLSSIKEITIEYIKDYCVEKGKKDVAWLKATIKKEVPPDKNGKARRISFIEIRQLFVEKYMPELLPVPKPKKVSMYDMIEALED